MCENCNGCYHRRDMGDGHTACHYILDMGEPRGCRPEKCDKKKTDEEFAMYKKDMLSKNVIFRYKCGASISSIAKTLGMSFNTIKAIIKENGEDESTLQS